MSGINITYLEKIIHEMNTPLQNLGMIPDLMLDRNIVMSEIDKRESLGYIQDSAEKLVQLVRMLSSITNLQSEKIKLNIVRTDIVDLIAKEVKYHTTRIKRDQDKQIEFIFNNKIEHCSAPLDKFWFGQLLANLIINAINHMDKGIIEVGLDIIKKDTTDYISLKVTDEGWGIPEDELEDIFKPLHRGSHSVGRVKGSGIGLAVAQEVVEAHGGSINAKNNKKAGSTFEVVIPCPSPSKT